MDDAPQSVYDPIGVAWKQPTGWNAMNEFFIKDEIAQYGPLEAAFGVPTDFGSFFSSSPQGVYVSGVDQKTHGGHSVAIVGWGSQTSGGNTQKYWLVRNSWGRNWAHGGYFKIEIGGHSAAGNVKFATASWGTSAIAPFFKTGSARRLVVTQPNDLLNQSIVHGSQEVNNQSNTSLPGHGSPQPCTEDHQNEFDTLKTWFLANQSHYQGVKPACSVPWTYESRALCTAKIIQGLQIETTLHVIDCDNVTYQWTVRWAWQLHTGNVDDAVVLLNDGPREQVPPGAGSNSSDLTKQANVESAGSAWLGRNILAAATVLVGHAFV